MESKTPAHYTNFFGLLQCVAKEAQMQIMTYYQSKI